MNKEKLKEVLKEIVASMSGISVINETARRWHKELDEALPEPEPEIVLGHEYCLDIMGKQYPHIVCKHLDKKDFEQMTSDELWDKAYQKGREDMKKEILEKCKEEFSCNHLMNCFCMFRIKSLLTP